MLNFIRAINWWYLPVVLVSGAGLLALCAFLLVCAGWPIWTCMGIVGLI